MIFYLILTAVSLFFEFEAPAASEKLDMNEAVAKIVRLERRVMWRKRLLSLQDGLALAVTIGGLIAAALVVLVRLRPITMPVVQFRTRRWYPLSLVSVVGLAAALMIPTRSLPVNETFAAERADIESAGEHLEQTAAEVEQAVPLGTETATLATEQAELGRVFRRSTSTRAEALRRLSALEERIRQRHDDLASTRADEIVSLADQRLGSALSTLSTARRRKIEPNESQLALPADEPPVIL